MKPTTLILLLATAIAISVVVRVRTNNLSGVETTTGASVEAGGQRSLQRLTSRKAYDGSPSRSSAEPVVPAAQSPTNPEAQRIIGEISIALGMSLEDAAEGYRLATEHAREHRTNRPAFPGTRTAIDTNRWPLFEGP